MKQFKWQLFPFIFITKKKNHPRKHILVCNSENGEDYSNEDQNAMRFNWGG